MFIRTHVCIASASEGCAFPRLHPCYSDGTKWNGWACPYFTRDALPALLLSVNNPADDPAEFSVRFDAVRDCVVITENGESYDVESQTIHDYVADKDVQVWGVGAFGWCWVEWTEGEILLAEMRAMYPHLEWEIDADQSDALGFVHEEMFFTMPHHSNPPWIEVDSVTEYGIAHADATRIEEYNEGRE